MPRARYVVLLAASPFLARRLVAFVYPKVFPERMEAARQQLAALDGMDNAERELRGVPTHP